LPATSRVMIAAAILAALFCSAPAPVADERATTGNPDAFTVNTLAPGIYLFRPTSTHGYTNSLVFERNDGLLIVDAQPTPAAAWDLMASIGRVATKKIRYLVFSHPHSDSSGGSTAFPEGTLRIASRGYRDAIADSEFDFGAERRLRSGEDSLAVEPDRPGATLVLLGRTRLEDDLNPVILLPVSHAHSPGDLLIFQPDAGIVAAGDLLFNDGRPFAEHAVVSSWLAQLNHLITMSPKWIVPMRGPAREPDHVRRQRNALIWLRNQVDEAFVNKVEPEMMPETILESEEISRHFKPADEPVLVRGLIKRQVEEIRERRRQMGLE